MEKTLKFLDKWGVVIVLAFLVGIYAKGCSTAKKVRKVEKETAVLCDKIDSLDAKTVDADEVRGLIKTVSATQTLIDEELIDKKQLSLTDLYKELK